MLISIQEPTDLVIVTHLRCSRRLTTSILPEVDEDDDDLFSILPRDIASALVAEVTLRLNVLTGTVTILASKLQSCNAADSVRHLESLHRLAVGKASAEKRSTLNCITYNNRDALKGRSLDRIPHPYLPIAIVK